MNHNPLPVPTVSRGVGLGRCSNYLAFAVNPVTKTPPPPPPPPRLQTKPRCPRIYDKGTLLGTPNREPQEYSKNIIGICLPGSLHSTIFLLYSWGFLFGVPSEVPVYDAFLGTPLIRIPVHMGTPKPYACAM